MGPWTHFFRSRMAADYLNLEFGQESSDSGGVPFIFVRMFRQWALKIWKLSFNQLFEIIWRSFLLAQVHGPRWRLVQRTNWSGSLLRGSCLKNGNNLSKLGDRLFRILPILTDRSVSLVCWKKTSLRPKKVSTLIKDETKSDFFFLVTIIDNLAIPLFPQLLQWVLSFIL